MMVDETNDTDNDTDTDTGNDSDVSNPFKIGDPVMDAAQGRAMVVLEAPDTTVAEWSEANNYDLTENYGNAKFDASEHEPVVRCVYISNVKSEPSKDYTFPMSRVRLIDAHHADDDRRIFDRVAERVLERMFIAAENTEDFMLVGDTAIDAGFDPELIDVAAELAEVETQIPGGDDDSKTRD